MGFLEKIVIWSTSWKLVVLAALRFSNAKELLNHTLKKKIENNSTWEGAFCQSEWAKINSQFELF